jgi:hypothetical protein
MTPGSSSHVQGTDRLRDQPVRIGAKKSMTTNALQSSGVLELDGALTIRQAAVLKQKMLDALAAADAVQLSIAADAEADLSFVQMIEVARIDAARQRKQLRLSAPASGQVLQTLQRAGLTTGMSAESREFWLHEKETL